MFFSFILRWSYERRWHVFSVYSSQSQPWCVHRWTTDIRLACLSLFSGVLHCYYTYHLRRIRDVRRFLDKLPVRQLIHAFVTSRLDYCNALFAGSDVTVHQRLQRIQHSAARLICHEPVSAPVKPLLQRLHWLPVVKRIIYKLCVLMFDVSHSTAPRYLNDMLIQSIDWDRRQRAVTSLSGLAEAAFQLP